METKKTKFNFNRLSKGLRSVMAICILPSLIICGCKKALEVELPVGKITGQSVYATSFTATSALLGIYTTFYNPPFTINGFNGLTLQLGNATDELKPTAFLAYPYYLNTYSSSTTDNDTWLYCYRYTIYACNSFIAGVQNSVTLNNADKQILLGEAKFLRAYTYFELVNVYGDVPLVLTTDFKANATIARSPAPEVYKQIIKDLIDAKAGLKDTYPSVDLTSSSTERIRVNRAAASALLARVYLYQKEWSKAELEATNVINDSNYALVSDLNSVFKANSKEAIWQLQTSDDGSGYGNTTDGRFFIPFSGSTPIFVISDMLLNSFEQSDKRKDSWMSTIISGTDSYVIPFKYKIGYNIDPPQIVGEYYMMLRLAEQYLIRAEARAQLGELADSANDINAIRNRAGLPNTTATTQHALVTAVAQERKVELFTETGHRFWDLKRTGKIDSVMNIVATIKGAQWSSYKALLPIPHSEFLTNPNLHGHQNLGYSE